MKPEDSYPEDNCLYNTLETCHVGVSLSVSSIGPFLDCGGFLFNASGAFSSPSYPGYYPNNAECVWEIEVNSGYRINLGFSHLQ